MENREAGRRTLTLLIALVMLGPLAAQGRVSEAVTIQLVDGQELTGLLQALDENEVGLKLDSGVVLRLPRSSVSRIRSVEKAPEDPSVSRYFFTPSAFALRAGQVNFTQTELVLSQFSLGLTNNIAVQVGTILPTWFSAGGGTPNVQLAAKVAGQITPGLRVAAGVFYFGSMTFDRTQGLLLPFGTVTLGDERTNLSVNVSTGSAFQTVSAFPTPYDDQAGQNFTLICLSGKVPLARGLAVLAEGYSLSSSTSLVPVARFGALGLRFNGQQLSSDLGFFFVPYLAFPLPWVNFSYTL